MAQAFQHEFIINGLSSCNRILINYQSKILIRNFFKKLFCFCIRFGIISKSSYCNPKGLLLRDGEGRGGGGGGEEVCPLLVSFFIRFVHIRSHFFKFLS